MKKTYLSKLYDLKTTALWIWITFIDFLSYFKFDLFPQQFEI